MTVVTQFLGSGSSLTELKRFYVQNGQVFKNPEPKIPGMTGNSITQEEVFQEEIYPFNKFGGMASMGKGKLPVYEGPSFGLRTDIFA
jgi:cellulose 1,4-beta-cellobiosidase